MRQHIEAVENTYPDEEVEVVAAIPAEDHEEWVALLIFHYDAERDADKHTIAWSAGTGELFHAMGLNRFPEGTLASYMVKWLQTTARRYPRKVFEAA